MQNYSHDCLEKRIFGKRYSTFMYRKKRADFGNTLKIIELHCYRSIGTVIANLLQCHSSVTTLNALG